jgi:type VI secretion system protein ImpJ
MSARELPAAIQWFEGMLLAPQHFQQTSLRQEALLDYHLAALSPYHWGVRLLDIDSALLVSGTFRVTALEAVMPDGLVVAWQTGDGGNTGEAGGMGGMGGMSLDLAPHAEEMKQRVLTVYLVVPARRAGDSPVRGELARYESFETAGIADENTGEGDVAVPRLRPRLSLVLAAEPPPRKYVGLPLARVSYRNETFARTEFVPPSLAVLPGSPLAALCQGIARRLREKAVFLSERVRNPSVAGRAPQLLDTKAMIQNLVAALPQFEAVLGTGVAHPYALYLALCSVVGHVAGVGRALVPPVLDPYDHADPWPRFEQAREWIYRVVDEGIIESYTGFPFYLEGGVFSLAFDQVWRQRSLVLGVRGPSGARERDLVAWMEDCLIGSKERIASLRERRILGAPRKRIEGEGDLVPATGVVLFALDASPDVVEPNQLLQIVDVGTSGAAQRPIEIVLYVKNQA